MSGGLTPAVVARNEAFLVIPPDHRDTVRFAWSWTP
jgi:hypothetical protein